MELKQEIGKRIAQSRKRKGLTIRELSEKLIDLKPTRISNWEQGLRTPGPNEVKMLSEVLDVSASYLLCLSNIEDEADEIVLQQKANQIPLLKIGQVENLKGTFKNIDKQKDLPLTEIEFINLDQKFHTSRSKHSFALCIEDSSMCDEFNPNDIAIFDPDVLPKPSSYVLAKNETTGEICFRRFVLKTEQNQNAQTINLVPLNNDWPIIFGDRDSISIIATLVEHRRVF